MKNKKFFIKLNKKISQGIKRKNIYNYFHIKIKITFKNNLLSKL